METISVIIPAYNCEKYIAGGIESVLAQSRRPSEIIVVDDGSQDGTRGAVMPYAVRGEVTLISKQNGGPSSARNAGILAASGEFIAFLDGDDLWEKEKLAKSLSFLMQKKFDWMCTAMVKIKPGFCNRRENRGEQCGGFFDEKSESVALPTVELFSEEKAPHCSTNSASDCKFRVKGGGERMIKRIPDDSWAIDPATREIRQLSGGLFFFSSLPVHTPTIVARKSCFVKAGIFDESFKVGEDTDLWLRFEEHGMRGGYLDEPLTIYRYNDNSITRGRRVDGLAEHLKVARKHAGILGIKNKKIRDSYAGLLWSVADIYYGNGNYIKAARSVFKSLYYNPANFRRILRKAAAATGGDRINVLYYDPTSGFGGSSRCLVSWLEKIDRARYRPFVLAHSSGPMMDKIRSMGIPLVKIPYQSLQYYFESPPKALGYAIALVDLFIFVLPVTFVIGWLLMWRRIDVIHLNSKIMTVVPGILAARFLHVPVVCHIHDTKPPIKRERVFSHIVDRNVVLTRKAMQLYSAYFESHTLALIPNGIDCARFSPDAHHRLDVRREFRIPQNNRIVGMVGRLVEGKGFDDFIFSAGLVAQEFSGVTFMIVGDDNQHGMGMERRLRRIVTDTGMGGRVIFTGWREDTVRLMAAFDILVQASSTFPEGFGLTVAEAMAMGKPVVVTDIPGPSEISMHGVTGYTVPPKNPAEMAKAIGRLLADQKRAAEMGAMGRARIQKEFNLDDTVKKIESLYVSLLNK